MVQASNQTNEVKPTNQGGNYCPACYKERKVKTLVIEARNPDDSPAGCYYCPHCLFELKRENQAFDPIDLIGYEVGGPLDELG